MGRVVALTGATGFIGHHLMVAFVDAGWEVRALSRRPEFMTRTGKGVTVLHGSLESKEVLERLVNGSEMIVHCAGVIMARTREVFHQVNAAGTARLAEVAAARSGHSRFVLISSLAARRPDISAYAASKREGEVLLARSAPDLDWQILRPPVVYGPGDRATLPWFRQFKRGVALAPGSRQARFSVLYVKDLARAVATLLVDPTVPRSIIELHDGHSDGYRWQDIAAAASRLLGFEVRCIHVPPVLSHLAASASVIQSLITGKAPMLTQDKLREIRHEDWVCRNNLLDRLTSWRPEVSIEDGFRETVAWYEAKGWL